MTKSQLKEKIKDLERDLWKKEQERIFAIEAEKIKAKKERMEITQNLAIAETKIEEIQKRYDDSAYKQLSDILKALVVKLPTLEIKELHTHSKEK